MKPGDIINNKRPGNAGHVVIFAFWKDKASRRFEALEQNGGPKKAVVRELTLIDLETGGVTIAEYDDFAPGPYYAQRLNSLP